VSAHMIEAEMSNREISLENTPPIQQLVSRQDASTRKAAKRYAGSGPGRLALMPIVVGLLTAATILLLIYQENRAVQYRIDATEVWSAYQVKIVQATVEEDPNLKAQYAEEQDVLRGQAQDLRDKSSNASHAAMISAYAALLLLLGAATAIVGLAVKRIHGGKKLYDRIPKLKGVAIGAPLLIVAFAIYILATNSKSSTPTGPSKSFANVTIKNFGQMDDHFYRGAQPGETEYKELAALGVKTIIDLRDDPLPYADKAAELAHLRYFNIPMSDKDYSKDESVEKFLSITKEEGK